MSLEIPVPSPGPLLHVFSCLVGAGSLSGGWNRWQSLVPAFKPSLLNHSSALDFWDWVCFLPAAVRPFLFCTPATRPDLPRQRNLNSFSQRNPLRQSLSRVWLLVLACTMTMPARIRALSERNGIFVGWEDDIGNCLPNSVQHYLSVIQTSLLKWRSRPRNPAKAPDVFCHGGILKAFKCSFL